MFKRITLFLCLAGGTFLSIGQLQTVHATQTQTVLASSIPMVKVTKILKKAAPILAISYPDACSAHQKGSLTIQEIGQNTDYYAVTMGGLQSIFIDLEDI